MALQKKQAKLQEKMNNNQPPQQAPQGQNEPLRIGGQDKDKDKTTKKTRGVSRLFLLILSSSGQVCPTHNYIKQ